MDLIVNSSRCRLQMIAWACGVLLNSLLYVFWPSNALAFSAKVAFVGNQVVDLTWADPACYSFERFRVLRDGTEIQSIDASDTRFFRDTDVSKGESHTYRVCKVCSGHDDCSSEFAVTVGQVDGAIYQDLTWTEGLYELHDDVRIEQNATLTIESDVTVEGVYENEWQSHSIYGNDGMIQVNGAALKGVGLLCYKGTNYLKNSCEVEGIGRSWGIESVIFEVRNDAVLELSGKNEFKHVDIRLNHQSTGVINDNDFYSSYIHAGYSQGEGPATIMGNRFVGSQVSVFSANTTTIAENTFRGLSGVITSEAINVYSTGPVTIQGNTFSMGPGQGAILVDKMSPVTVENNTIQDCSVGLRIGTDGAIYSEPEGATAVTGNVFANCDYGVKFYTGKTTLTNNTFVGNNRGVYLNFWLAEGASCVLHENCIAGNETTGVEAIRRMDAVLDAKNNWWGHDSGPTHTDNPVGQGDTIVASDIVFSPWLVTDNCKEVPPALKRMYALKGRVTNAWEHEMPGFRVVLEYDGTDFETSTNSFGEYEIFFEGDLGQEAELALIYELKTDDKTYFTIGGFAKGCSRDEMDVTDACRFQPFSEKYTFALEEDTSLTRDYVLGSKGGGDEYPGWLYFNLAKALAFYAELGVDPKPIRVRPFLRSSLLSPKAHYAENLQMIEIANNFTVYKGREDMQFAEELEYHEYAHHIMHCLYGVLPKPSEELQNQEIKEQNHAGYINPSTGDSLVEGFAIFMAAVIEDIVDGKPQPEKDSVHGNLNAKYLAWERTGRSECAAAAGILWDLYNGFWPPKDIIQLPFAEIWEVLKQPHPHMHSVYNALVAKYPNQKAGIDQLFIIHGFFADENEGNGEWDPHEPSQIQDDGTRYFVDYAENIHWDAGETIGQATNYNRQWRHYPPYFEGQFIKVNNDVPAYQVSVTFPQEPHLDYDVISINRQGFVYVPVPPEAYEANIEVAGYGTELVTGNPLHFTNEAFWADYIASREQGYFVAHDFQITGDYEPLPETDPSLLQGPVPGDFSASGRLDLADAIVALQVISGDTTTSFFEEAVVREDGKIRIGDAAYVLQALAGLRD